MEKIVKRDLIVQSLGTKPVMLINMGVKVELVQAMRVVTHTTVLKEYLKLLHLERVLFNMVIVLLQVVRQMVQKSWATILFLSWKMTDLFDVIHVVS